MAFRPQATEEQLHDLNEELLAGPSISPMAQGETLSPEEIAEIERMYSLSQPIKIPNDKLDPNYVYRWISKDIANFRARKAKGWQILTKALLEQRCRPGVTVDDLHMGTHTNPDDMVCLNQDMVLGCLPTRLAHAYQQHHLKRSQAREGSAAKRFHATGQLAAETMGEGAGFSTFDRR